MAILTRHEATKTQYVGKKCELNKSASSEHIVALD